MATNRKTIWAIRGGKTGDANTLFLQKNFVAIGWNEAGDLSKLAANREAFKQKLAEAYPDNKPGAIPVNAGQTFRFVHEVKIGDLIVYPSKVDRLIHIGEITGNFQY